MSTFSKVLNAGQCFCCGATLLTVGASYGSAIGAPVLIGAAALTLALVIKRTTEAVFDKMHIKPSSLRDINEWAITIICAATIAAFAAMGLGVSATFAGGLWFTLKTAAIVACVVSGILATATSFVIVAEVAYGRRFLLATQF